MLSSANVVGKHADVSSSAIALQSGSGTVSFTGTAGETVQIAIVDAAGRPLRDATVTADAGSNLWVWNGEDNAGNPVPDGAYRIALVTGGANGAAAPVPFDVLGTATGLASNNGTVSLSLGALSVPLSSLHALTN